MENNTIKAEKLEADILIDRGMEFTTEKKSLLKYFSKKKQRTWLIKEPYAGTLDYITSVAVQINFDEVEINKDPLTESKRLVHQHIHKCAEIIAIAVLNSKWRIKLFKRIMTHYFLWRVTPSKLKDLASIISLMMNLKDFMISIRLTSAVRTTKPNLIEQDKKA